MSADALLEGVESEGTVFGEFDDDIWNCAGDIEQLLAQDGLLSTHSDGSDSFLPTTGSLFDACDGRPWRCLPGSGCSASSCSCSPPPLPDDEGLWELVGDPGKKNGEKKLRAGILRTPEWNDKETCRLLIEAAESMGGPNDVRLAALVRIHRVTELRKSHLLAIARHWRYRSYLWRPRSSRKDAAVAQSANHAPQQHLKQPLEESDHEHRPRPAKIKRGDAEGASISSSCDQQQGSSSPVFVPESAPPCKDVLPALLPVSGPFNADSSALFVLALESIRLYGEGIAKEMRHCTVASLGPELTKINIAKHSGVAMGIRFLMNLNCETTAATRLCLERSRQSSRSALLGPDPLALHVFGGKQAPVEAPWSLMSDFFLSCCTNENLVPDVVSALKEAEGEEAVESYRAGGLKGVELVGHIQAAHARARLGTVAEYTRVLELITSILQMYGTSALAIFEGTSNSLKARCCFEAAGGDDLELSEPVLSLMIPSSMRAAMSLTKTATREHMANVALHSTPLLTLLG